MELMVGGLIFGCLAVTISCVILWQKLSTIKNLNSTRAAQARVLEGDVAGTLDTRLRQLDQRLKAVEMEWENTFQQLKRMMGRIAKEKNVDAGAAATETVEASAQPLTRADVLRRSRGV